MPLRSGFNEPLWDGHVPDLSLFDRRALRRREVTLKVGAYTVTVFDDAMRPVANSQASLRKEQRVHALGTLPASTGQATERFLLAVSFQHLSEPLQDFCMRVIHKTKSGSCPDCPHIVMPWVLSMRSMVYKGHGDGPQDTDTCLQPMLLS